MHPLLLSALIQIESHGNDLARGRHGELGALQIKPIMVRDVNRLMGTHYAHAQVTNRAVAKFIAHAYLSHYGKHLSDESLARIWQARHARIRTSNRQAILDSCDSKRTPDFPKMKLTIQSKQNAQTIVDLFNAILTGEESESGATPLSIYDDNKHICSLVAKDGTQILELIIEREDGDKLCPGTPDSEVL
jgi:hypothetical protein